MGYSLGIDLGATTCLVALRRGAAVEVCRIGEDGAAMPAVALPRDDGTLLVGEQAEARSEYEPALVARYVVSRLGDGAPIDIDGHHLDPLALTRSVLREAIDRAAPLPGVAPDHVVVTYPLLPGVGPEELIADAAAEEFGPTATLVPAPVAAVARLAAEQGFGDDAVVVVVDLGGSSVDVTLVRRTPTAFDLIGDPASLSDLGGVDLDGAVLSLVEGAIGDVSSMVVPGDSAGMLALRRLRTSCRAAKERLSVDDTAVVEVAMPNARGRVEITRDAFERTIEAALVEAVDLVMATIEDAGLIPADLRAVIVTGGSARIPRVTELLRENLGLPVVSEARPEATVALGAALFADVADDLAGPAGGAPGPLSGSTGSPPGSTGAGSGLGIAALGLGAAGAAAAGLAGAGAAGAAEGGITELPGLPFTGLESIPAIGPTTGGGPLPWEDAHPGAHGDTGPPPEDQAPASWPDQAGEEPPPWSDPPVAPDPWASTPPEDPPADPWTTVSPDAPADPWATVPPEDPPADPWTRCPPTPRPTRGPRSLPRTRPPTRGPRPRPRTRPPTRGPRCPPTPRPTRGHLPPPMRGRRRAPVPRRPTRGLSHPPTRGPHPTPTRPRPPTPGEAPTTRGRPVPSPRRAATGAGRPIPGPRAPSPPCPATRRWPPRRPTTAGPRAPSPGSTGRRPAIRGPTSAGRRRPVTTRGPTAAREPAPRRGAGTTGATPARRSSPGRRTRTRCSRAGRRTSSGGRRATTRSAA